MHHYVAFLRGINLGQRRIKMNDLRRHFERMKFADVATFIASGNVIFASKSGDGRKLARLIKGHLRQALGYDVDTFVRTRAEVAAVAAFQPFSKAEVVDATNTVHAGFLSEALTADQARRLESCRTEVDEFCVNGREFYWLCRIRTPESKVWSSPEIKAVALPSTSMRNLTTLRRLAAEYPVVSA